MEENKIDPTEYNNYCPTCHNYSRKWDSSECITCDRKQNRLIALIGAGDFGREVYAHLIDQKIDCEISYFESEPYCYQEGKDYVLPLDLLNTEVFEVLICIQDANIRKHIVSQLPKKTKYFTFIHKSAQILDANCEIGEGSIICANTVITTNVKIGKHAHLNIGCVIGHDCKVDDYCTLSPMANLGGRVHLKEGVFMGSCANVLPKITIAKASVIGASACVVKSITEEGLTHVGVPSKILK